MSIAKLGAVVILLFSASVNAVTLDDVEKAYNNNNKPLAFRIAKQLADKGNAEAQNLVGSLFFTGKWEVTQDEKKAFHYFKLCEDNPNSSNETKSACFRMLSFAYVKGKGVSKDVNVGTNYLWKSAHLGDERAANSLVDIFCKKDDESCPSIMQEKIARCADLPCN